MSKLRIQRIDGGARVVVFTTSSNEEIDVETRLHGPRPSKRPPPPLPLAARLPRIPRPAPLPR